MFWDKFVYLCNQHDVKPNPVAKELGISSGTVTGWKKGRIPQTTTLEKIAVYFGVSVDYLLGKEEHPGDTVRSPDIKEAPAGNPEGAETEDPSSDELRRRISEALSRLDPSYLEIVAAQIDALQALQESREEKGSLHD